MIYTDSALSDRNNIVQHINEFTLAAGQEAVLVDTQKVHKVCLTMREKASFPHVDGIDESSVFKKAAHFVTLFLESRPIESEMQIKWHDLVSCDMNAVVALDIAIICMENSTIMRDKGIDPVKVSVPIYVSRHSYADIIEVLSAEHIGNKTHFHMLAVLFEQLTYKTNPHCEYRRTSSDMVYGELGPVGENGSTKVHSQPGLVHENPRTSLFYSGWHHLAADEMED